MDQFLIFLRMGFEHICDLKGIDHLLFILVLSAVYHYMEWKKVAILVTAFTIGHSITLALSALKFIVLNSSLVEILIACTILITSITNLFYDNKYSKKHQQLNYLLALCFGFIHGMGFSGYFSALMSDSANITFPLFAFNLGLEAGQLLILLLFFSFYFVLTRFKRIDQKAWCVFFSGAGAGVSVLMIIERI